MYVRPKNDTASILKFRNMFGNTYHNNVKAIIYSVYFALC